MYACMDVCILLQGAVRRLLEGECLAVCAPHCVCRLQAHIPAAVQAEDGAEGSAVHGPDSNSNTAGAHTGSAHRAPFDGGLQLRVHGLHAVVHVGDVWVQLPCEFGLSAGHLLAKGCVDSLIGVRLALGPPGSFGCCVCGQPVGVRPPRHKNKNSNTAGARTVATEQDTADFQHDALFVGLQRRQHTYA
jgi:hypothetical protein